MCPFLFDFFFILSDLTLVIPKLQPELGNSLVQPVPVVSGIIFIPTFLPSHLHRNADCRLIPSPVSPTVRRARSPSAQAHPEQTSFVGPPHTTRKLASFGHVEATTAATSHDYGACG